MTKIINIFGGPGCGKSTTAAGLFHYMKAKLMSVELVTEYAKDVVWENNKDKLNDQLYVFAKQNHKLERLRGKVDYVITDSPIILSQYYGSKYSNLHNSVLTILYHRIFTSYDNINVLLNRTKPYIKLGRLGSEEEAIEADIGIKELLKYYSYTNIEYDNNSIHSIIKLLE